MANLSLPRDPDYHKAVAFNEYMEFLNLTEALNVPPAGEGSEEGHNIRLAAPEGYISSLEGLHIRIPAPPNASQGVHGVVLYYGKGEGHVDVAHVVMPYDTDIEIKNGEFMNAEKTTVSGPKGPAFTYQLKSLPYSTDVPLGFHYYNITDVDQTETWHFLAVVKHRQVITF